MTSRLITIIAVLIAQICAISASAKSWMHVYRNDSTFNSVSLENGTRISHITNDDRIFMTVENANGDSIDIAIHTIDSCAVRHTNIPAIYIDFPDYPDVDQIWDKELYLSANMRIDGNGYTSDASDLKVSVKGRGNSTWNMPKKPMRLKFDKKTSICGFKKAKNYALIANFIDTSLCQNALTLWIANRMGMQYSNHSVPCDVYINNNYAGSFILTEKIGINSGSVDIDETAGILFEISSEFDEEYKFRSDSLDLPVMVKDPDLSELFQADQFYLPADIQLTDTIVTDTISPIERYLNMWRDDFNRAEALAVQGRGFEAFDLDSFVDYMLIYNFAGNNEIEQPKSVYCYKTDLNEDTPYYFGPVWDFDYAYKHYITPSYSPAPSRVLVLNSLFRVLCDTEEFKNKYRERFQYFAEEIYPEAMQWLDQYTYDIEPSAKLNGLRWPDSGDYQGWIYYEPTFDTKRHITELKEWIEARMQFLHIQAENGEL